MRGSKQAALHAHRDDWTKQAFAACVAAAKDLIGAEGPMRPFSPIGKLGDDEWGWVVSTVVWAWISTRAEQAAAEGWNIERAIRATGLEPDPWLAGAVASILPKLAEAELDWSQPIGAWSKDDVVALLLAAFGLTQRACAARDAAEEQIAGRTSPDVVARELNAAAGNPLMTAAELRDIDIQW
jgi:hypothetical protein